MKNKWPWAIPQNKKYANQGLVGSVKKLYLEAKSSDVKFLFGASDGAGASVVAHKSLLAAASPVFDAMFYGDLKESGDVHVPDSSEAAFMEFLQFFYLAEVELTEENIAGVMYLGHKYNVAECISVCNRFLKDIRSVENIFMILDLATTYDQQELMKMCDKFILLDTAAVLESASFLESGKKILAHILKMDLLSCSEVELFEACMSWVKAKSGQEAVSKETVEAHLDELFYQIRFASMTVEQLCDLVAKYDAVLRKDFVTITSMVTIPLINQKISIHRHAKPNGIPTQPSNVHSEMELFVFIHREKFIILDTATVLKSATFLNCDKKILAHILKMGLLLCSEVELFDACMSWVKAKSEQETVSKAMVEMHLGNLYYQIRFASMTTKDLCILADEYGMVLQSDFMTIAKMITIPEYQSLKFNSSPRQAKWNADAAIECSFRNGNVRCYKLHSNSSITFSTSEVLLLGGFMCGRVVRIKLEDGEFSDLTSDLLVDVDVIESTDSDGADGKVLLKMKAHLQSADTKVMLSQILLIRPGFFYRISLGPFPHDHGYISELLRKEMPIQSNVTIELNKSYTLNTPTDISTHGKVVGLIWALVLNNI